MDNVNQMLGGTPIRDGGMYNYVPIVQLTQEEKERAYVRWTEICETAHKLGIQWESKQKFCTLRNHHEAAKRYGLILTDTRKRSGCNQPEGWVTVA
jgi:hypothetical protein